MAFLYMLLLGGGLFIGNFIAMSFSPKLIAKYSTRTLYNGSNLLCIVPYILIFVAYLISPSGLTNPAWVAAYFVLFTFAGGCGGVTTVLSTTMIAKSVDYEEYVNHRRPDGIFFSGMTFIAKLTGGIATIISGVAYAIVGFSDSRIQELNAYIAAGGTPRLVGEYGSFMMILFFIVSVLPAIGCILAVIPTWRYCLDNNEHLRIVAVLHARRDAADHGITLTKEEEENIRIVDGEIVGLPVFTSGGDGEKPQE
jgi:Na+/melibiose symporter-like transporter